MGLLGRLFIRQAEVSASAGTAQLGHKDKSEQNIVPDGRSPFVQEDNGSPEGSIPARRRRRRRKRQGSGPTVPSSNRSQKSVTHSHRGSTRPRTRGNVGSESHQTLFGASADPSAPERVQNPDLEKVKNVSKEDYPQEFVAMGLSDRALSAVASLGFVTPTPIQTETIPILLKGADVVGQAQTGTGKTLAFSLPIVENIDPGLSHVQAIILVPTRELAQQVFGVLDFIAGLMGINSAMLMGGRRLDEDFIHLEKGPQIIVGTPGRILDHLQRRTLRLDYVRIAVLDEADRMLDIGFEPDMRRILGRCPKGRQTALYSATIPTAIKTLIWRYMDDPVHVEIEPEQPTAREITQRYYEVAERDKIDGLEELLPEMTGQTLVFCNMKVTVDKLVRRLGDRKIPAQAIHGDLDQRKRDRVMQKFRTGELQILVATNVASRGLDIPDVSHVVNFDVPQNPDEYIHRVGRTGRAGRDGSAITFVGEWDFENFAAIQKVVGDVLERSQLALYGQ